MRQLRLSGRQHVVIEGGSAGAGTRFRSKRVGIERVETWRVRARIAARITIGWVCFDDRRSGQQLFEADCGSRILSPGSLGVRRAGVTASCEDHFREFASSVMATSGDSKLCTPHYEHARSKCPFTAGCK